MRDEADLLEAMVSIPSPSGREGAVAAYLEGILPSLGYRVTIDTVGSVIASRGAGRPQVMYLGHMDTVPGDLPVVRREGRLHGRGSVDAKGCLAAALAAGANLPEVRGTLTIVGAVGEEADSRGARHLLGGPPADFLIVGEPGGWDRVTIAYKGLLRLRYRVEVEATHGSAPTPSAGDLAVEFAAAVRRTMDAKRGPSPLLSPTAKTVHLETGTTEGRDRAEVRFEVRVPPDVDPGALVEALVSHVQGGRLEVVESVPPVEVDRGNAVVRALNASIRALGGIPAAKRKAGTSDMNLAAQVWAVPMATYGPGDSHLDHGPAEAMDLRDLGQARRVLQLAFARLGTMPAG